MGYMSTDPGTGQPVWVDDYGQVTPILQTDDTGQVFGPQGQINTWSQPQPTQISTTQIKPVDAPLGTYIDGGGKEQPKKPTAPPAYDPIPDYQNNLNNWTRQQTNQDIYLSEALRGSQLERQGAYTDWANATGPMVNQIPGFYQQANADRTRNTQQLADQYAQLNAQDQAGLNQFNTRMNDLYSQQVPMVTAAQWQSNAQDISNQNRALGNFNDIYGGSLDYQAAQAQAVLAQAKMAQLYQYASDPSDVKRQKAALEELHGMINGGEWADNLRDVRDEYKARSGVEMTAQERFMMENFRQQREDQERSRRQAVQSDLAGRGLLSGAAEQAGMLSAQQDLGRQNVLAQLGAASNAITRSQQSMAGWANTSAAGREAQLQAQGMYIDAAGNLRDQNDRVGMFNTAEANQTERLNATNATNVSMHNSAMQTNTNQFNAAQTNQARANNQQTRLSGAVNYANQANQIRSNNDAVGTFNVGQTNLVNLQNQQTTLADLQRRGNVAATQQQGQLSTSGQIGSRQSEITDRNAQDIDLRLGGQVAGTGAQLGWQGQNLQNRMGVANSGADTAVATHGVFSPTIATTAQGQDRITQARFAQDPNKRLG